VVVGTDDDDPARAFVEALRSETGREALERAGFVVPR